MKPTLVVIVIGLLLAACNAAPPRASAVWTRAELENILDLAELGELSAGVNGDFVIGGKQLPPELAEEFRTVAYGGTFNHLKIDDETMNALPITVRDFFLEASPDELREALAQIGLSAADIRRLQQLGEDGSITWSLFRDTIYAVAERTGKLALFNVSRLNSNKTNHTAPLNLVTYDITGRTIVNTYALDCNIGSGDFRIASTSSTTSSPASYSLAAKTSLTIGGVLRSDPFFQDSYGPISGISDAYTHRHPCQTPFPSTRAEGWHKGKHTSASLPIIKTSYW